METTNQPETFEYLLDVFPENELQGRLDELGMVGWELITAKWEEFSYGGRSLERARCILKRRVLRKRDIFADDLEDDGDEFASTLEAVRRS